MTAFLREQLINSLELLTEPERLNISENSGLFPISYFPNLPPNFPDSATMPLYLYGDKVNYQSSATETADCGIIIGRFYAFDRDRYQWRWKYVILANQDLAIDTFNFTYVCWETDLNPLDLD